MRAGTSPSFSFLYDCYISKLNHHPIEWNDMKVETMNHHQRLNLKMGLLKKPDTTE